MAAVIREAQILAVAPDGGPARDAFRALPARIYRDDASWAPASVAVEVERFADAVAGRIGLHALVAIRDGQPIARAAAISEPAARGPDGQPEGWIGLFECLPGADARAAAVAVLQECRRWLRDAGCGRVIVPRTDGLVAGLLVAGFDEPQTVFTAHNPAWYADVLREAGAAAATRMLSYRFTRDRVPRFPRHLAPGIRVRGADTRRLEADIGRFHAFQTTVFGGNPGHLPRSVTQSEQLASRLLPLIDPDLVLFAEDRHGAVAGLLVCLPDAWQRRPEGAQPDRARIVSIGVLPGWRRHGVALAMGAELAHRLLEKGYQTLEASWVMGDNRPPQLLAAAVQARPSREFALFALEGR